jgi:hypothetical protein
MLWFYATSIRYPLYFRVLKKRSLSAIALLNQKNTGVQPYLKDMPLLLGFELLSTILDFTPMMKIFQDG